MSYYSNFVEKLITPESIVLDLGCGSGEFGAIRRIGFRGKLLIGIDIDKDLLKRNSDVKFGIIANAHSLPSKANVFDLIICRGVLEHLANPAFALAEASRVLEPGSKAVFQTPNKFHPLCFLSSVFSLRTRALLKRWFTHTEKLEGNYETYYKCNTKKQFYDLFKRNGLLVSDFVYEDIGWDWLSNPVIKAIFVLLQKMTDQKSLHCFKPQIICVGLKKSEGL